VGKVFQTTQIIKEKAQPMNIDPKTIAVSVLAKLELFSPDVVTTLLAQILKDTAQFERKSKLTITLTAGIKDGALTLQSRISTRGPTGALSDLVEKTEPMHIMTMLGSVPGQRTIFEDEAEEGEDEERED
jgi:hypothetical protein